MKKVEAIKFYVEANSEWIKEMLKNGDRVALSEDWAMFTDMLCKDGEITEKQYNTWIVPDFRNWIRRLNK